MQLLCVVLVVVALILAKYSWKCLIYYSAFTGGSLWLVHVFLVNKFELDFDVVFKFFEWVGYGTPRFLESRTGSTSEHTSQDNQIDCRIPKPVSDSVEKLVNNVLRDFVKSWYKEVADGDVFVAESKTVLNRLVTEIYLRMNQLDSHYLVEQVILVFHAHLVRFNRSLAVLKNNESSLQLTVSSSQVLHNAYESQVYPKHTALSNSVSELNYLRTVVDTLLTALAPRDVFSCDMGRFILREILAVQAVELVDLLSDSDWVNEAIIDLLSPPVPKQRQINLNSLKELTDGNSQKDSVSFCETDTRDAGEEGSETRAMESIRSETKQVQSTERTTSLDELDNKIIDSSNDDSNLPRRIENTAQLESVNTSNVNNQHSNSFVEIHPSDPQAKDQESQSSLENSWGFCPSAQDNTFHTQSFEAMKAKALERERKLNSTQKVKEFGSEVRKLGSCCTAFDVSVEIDHNSKGNSSRLRYRSASLPDELQIIPDKHEHHMPIFRKRTVTRSVSFPANISSVVELDEEPTQPISTRPVRSTTVNHPSHSYGSPYQNLSFCSSEGSFKSFSDEDSDLEEAQEMDEGSDSDHNEILENIAPLPIMRPPRRKSISRQAEVIEDGCFGTNDKLTTLPEYSLHNGRITENGYHRNKTSPQSSKDSDLSERRSPTEPSSSPKLESDTSFGDSVIMAGRKFISSIRSPVKKFGFSSSSSKSTSMSSGADSMEVNVPSSIDTASFDSDLPLYRPPQADSPSSSRKLSRSNAVMDISSESDTETFYGTPMSIREEIVYGTPSGGGNGGSGGRDVVRIHPSQMISIPSSETAFESDWEPGRNKFTLYRIEYDIRIWPTVYKALLEEADKQNQDENNEPKEHKKKTFHHKRAIKRRYREFMELHNRLTNGPLAVYMKDILKPNRKYNLPFGRLDKDVVEGRRSLLQYYLVSLVSKPELRESHELQQFLGVIGGGSFIKPSVAKMMSQSVHVPRVDKMLSRQMTKVIDSIKTAFDSDDQENVDSGRLSPLPDIGCPWNVECHGNHGTQPSMLDLDQVDTVDCFSAFLENLELSKPSWYYDNSDTESSFHDSSSDDDAVPFIMDPLVANDRSDIPNQPSLPSVISKDDMLYGVLGSKPPGLCIPHSYSYCAGDGSTFERDMVDFGRKHGRRHNKVSPRKENQASSEPRSSEESLDDSTKPSRSPRISKKHVEKLKSAAQKAKEKKAESLESISHVKDKVKKHMPSSESLENITQTKENITHAKEKVKAFKRNVESMENIHQAKEKVRSFKKKIPDVESMENLHQAKEKMKSFRNKIPDAEENLTQAKERVKKLKKKLPNVESMENLNQAKEKVKAFKQKLPDAEENFNQAKEKVKELKKKIPTTESNENLAHAKEKVQTLKMKMKKSPKISKKDQLTGKQEGRYDDGNVALPVKVEKPEKASAMSRCDEPSEPVAEVAEDIFPVDPQFPLSHAILNLTCEVMKGHDSWAGVDRVQETFKGIFGALFEWFVRGEIDDVLTDECWSEYLENLNDVVWPGGILLEKTDQVKTEEQKEQTKQKAIQTLKEFFPDIFQLLVGTKVYHECAVNSVESLQNPAINRILIYILLELFLSELIPELQRNMYTDIHGHID